MQSTSYDDTALTPIQKFYDGQNILITGSTGFLGKLLIEKLLRSCPTIKCIYILIRPKKGKSVLERENELFNDMVFCRLYQEQPNFRDRVVSINGDCNCRNLGIAMDDKIILTEVINIIFHAAAVIKFNENIKSAVTTNALGMIEMISLSKEMPKLKSFVYISTLYSNCPYNPIEEKFYEPSIDPEKLFQIIRDLNEKELNNITPKLLGPWPNTYTYTKSVSENIVKKIAGLIPIGIFRPGIVISTYREPIPGWINNLNGPVGALISVGLGFTRTLYCNESAKASLVPGDVTTNAIIVSAWDIANNRRSNEDIPIYNYESSDNPITYGELIKLTFKYGLSKPSLKTFWYYSLNVTKYRWLYLFYIFFLHILPALLMDFVRLCFLKSPKILKMYFKLHSNLRVLDYFSTNEWIITNERWTKVTEKLTNEDRELFFCDIKDVVWDTFFRTFLLGVRLYVLKDPISTLPKALRKWQRLFWMHQAFKLVIVCIFLLIIWMIISKIF